MSAPSFTPPPFRPHPLVRGGHAQTLVGFYLPGKVTPYRATPHRLALPDGDTLILHDDCPPDWRPHARTVLLVHGLAGCHGSGYMVRIAHKLNARGVRVFRLDLRGCGAGQGLAKQPYHAGRSEDALAAVREIVQLCPDSPLAVVGFSLGGNIVLKMLGEHRTDLPPQLVQAAAICPAIDLAASVAGLNGPATRFYDRYFVRALMDHLGRQNGFTSTVVRRPRTLLEFDDCYTAPHSGFGTAAAYYARCSSLQFIPTIQIPTLILTAQDDPLVPVGPIQGLAPHPMLTVRMTASGGHLGFIARPGLDPDCRWMDWRVVEWVMHV